MPYSIVEHKHRFAVWAASRAASVNGCRFKVEIGKALLEETNLHLLIENPQSLPNPDELDAKHRIWRKKIIQAGKKHDLDVTHGVAAKLINIYLKSAFICGGHHSNDKVKALHPPIDSLILDSLKKNKTGGKTNLWKQFAKKRWSKLDCREYELLIENLRTCFNIKDGFWLVESHWQGFR